jgi:two-component system, NtrC family, response regulator HydG
MPIDERAEALSRITQAIGRSLELGDVFARVAEAARLLLPFDAAGVTLVADPEHVRVYAVSGDHAEASGPGRISERTGYSPRLWPAGELPASRIADAREELDAAYPVDARILADGFRSVLRVPLAAQDELLGFQWFVSRQPDAFTEEHERAVRPIADLVTLALQHERLFGRERERRRRREVLDALLPAIAQALDVREVLRKISDAAQQVLAHDFVLIVLLGGDGKSARMYAITDGEIMLPEVPLTPEAAHSFTLESIVIRDVEIVPGDPPRARFHVTHPRGAPPWVDTEVHPGHMKLLMQNKPRAQLRVPLRQDGRTLGSLIISSRKPDAYTEADVDVARRIGDVIELAMAHQRLAEEMRRAAEERGRAERLEAKVAMLREELESRTRHRALGDSPSWRHVLQQAAKVAAVETTVLLQGESGTGKEVVARLVHGASPRKDGPFVAINCAALPEQLLESELFGYERGAFTGALTAKPGRIEQAAGGVLFLDEVGEMSPVVQAKLLRVLQEREFERVGDSKTVRVDVRVVAATNESLEDEIDAGRFREDLYYRLNVVPIPLPPLRERREDIPLLAQFFLKRYGEQNRRDVPDLTPDLTDALLAYDWPGNVRELENTIERLVVLSEGRKLSADLLRFGKPKYALRNRRPKADDVPGLVRRLVEVGIRTPPPNGAKLYDFLVGGVERELIEQVMRQADDVKVTAADRLGINRNTLHKKLDEFDRADRGTTDAITPPAGDGG